MNSNYIFVVLTHFLGVFLVSHVFFYIAPQFITNILNCSIALVSIVLVGCFTFQFTKKKWLNDRVQSDGKAVFITGCDRGFGHDVVIHLDSLGYHVFASCLYPDGPGAEKLKNECSPRLQVLGMDVTKDESVKKALEFVKENLGPSELWAVVNNAGIFKGLSVELTPMQDFKDNMEVNAYGSLRVTKAFLPLLRQSKGRLVNFTSLIGRLTIPHFTAYTMSKYAAAGLTDCLRQEMDIWGVTVISIEPEIYKTGLTDKTFLTEYLDSTLEKLDDSIKADYGDKYFETYKKLQNKFLDFASPKIETVVEDVISAVTSVHPDRVYSPRRNSLIRCFFFIHKIAPLVIQDFFLKVTTFLILRGNLTPASR